MSENNNPSEPFLARCNTVIGRYLSYNSNKNSGVDLEVLVTSFIQAIGVPANIKGYYCLREAIIYTVKHQHEAYNVDNTLYTILAEQFNTTALRVDNAIRYAITAAWNKRDLTFLEKYLGSAGLLFQKKPANLEFIAFVANRLNILTESIAEAEKE